MDLFVVVSKIHPIIYCTSTNATTVGKPKGDEDILSKGDDGAMGDGMQ